ncbi:MAG: hypothetical protein AB7Q29_14100 [Vicinamibacterales bacterium]
MDNPQRPDPTGGPDIGPRGADVDLIALAQKLARDAERHALLSASLASQAERLMTAGLRRLERASTGGRRPI